MVSLASTRKGASTNRLTQLGSRIGTWLPPFLGIGSFLLIWQILAMVGLIALPAPSSLLSEERTRNLLLYPFYDRGGLDKGLFWQTMASLTRVAQGYTLAALVGIGVGLTIGLKPAINRAFDPLFQFLRMVAPLAWVPIALVLFQKNQPAAIFVIFHHRRLADSDQHG